MYLCNWHVSAEQIDLFSHPFQWKVSFCLSTQINKTNSIITTLFSVHINHALDESEAIRLAFDNLDERHLVNDGEQ